MSSMSRPRRLRSVRPSALTTPADTVDWNPYGFPTAITSCPTRSGSSGRERRAQEVPKPGRVLLQEIGRFVFADDLGIDATPIDERDAHVPCAIHDVLVGQRYPSGVMTTPEPAPPACSRSVVLRPT